MTKPNILFIFADQLRHDMVGCYGHPNAITPHLDKLATEGTRFSQCYSTNPICLPARSSIITGKYCHNHHCHDNGHVLAADEICWPALLRDNGYYTSLVGKLHLWEQWRTPSFTAVDHGFQYKQMMEGKASFHSRVEESGWYFDYLRDKGLPLPCRANDDPECLRMGRARISEYNEEDYIDGVIGARAVRQILEEPARDRPFCMQVGFCSPHEFYDPPQRFFDMYQDIDLPDPVFDSADNHAKSPGFQGFQKWCGESMNFPEDGYNEESLERVRFMRRCYLATVTFIDDQIGRIVAALKQAGTYENTAIIFMSDHGEFIGERGCVQKKFFLYDDNVHVPFIIHAPFLKAAPGVVDGPVQNLDLFATILEMAGIDMPSGTDSRSLIPAIKDPTFLTRDAAFAQAYERRMVRQGKYKLIMDNNPLGTELYDLVSDPGERINLARDLKDVSKPTSNTEYLTIIEQLQRRMLMWYSETEGIKDVRAPNQQF